MGPSNFYSHFLVNWYYFNYSIALNNNHIISLIMCNLCISSPRSSQQHKINRIYHIICKTINVAMYSMPCMWIFKFLMILKGLVILWFALLRWYGVGLGLGKPNFVLMFFIMIFTLAPPFNKTSSKIFFLICT